VQTPCNKVRGRRKTVYVFLLAYEKAVVWRESAIGNRQSAIGNNFQAAQDQLLITKIASHSRLTIHDPFTFHHHNFRNVNGPAIGLCGFHN